MENTLKNSQKKIINEKKTTNKMALISLILGIASLRLNIFCIPGIVAIIFAIISLFQIQKTKEQGLVMAIIGLILGVVITTLNIAVFSIFSL